MAEYFRVSPRIWLEHYNDDVRLLAFYLLTCKHRELAGIYLLPLAYAAEDLHWEIPRLRASLELLIAERFCSYDEQARVVFIRKALSYQAPANPNQETHCFNALDDLPRTPLLDAFLDSAKRYCTEGYAKTFAGNLEKHLKERLSQPFQEPLSEGLMEPSDKGFGQSTTTTKATAKEKTTSPKTNQGTSEGTSEVPQASSRGTSEEMDIPIVGDLREPPQGTDRIPELFDRLWTDSGKIGSREDARVAYLGWLKQGASADDLYLATMRYYSHCEKTDTAKKHLSTFLSHRNRQNQSINRWLEWLTEEHGSGNNGRQQGHQESVLRGAIEVFGGGHAEDAGLDPGDPGGLPAAELH